MALLRLAVVAAAMLLGMALGQRPARATCVAAPPCNVTSHGGPELDFPTVSVVFWGSEWNDASTG